MNEIRDIKIDLVMGNQNQIVDLFREITSGIEIINCDVYHKDGLEFIYHKDGQWIFYQDCKNEKFWTHYYRYWKILEKELSLEYEEIQAITKLLVDEALKREVTTPIMAHSGVSAVVDEAIKREVTTPHLTYQSQLSRVDEALKREVTTPLILKEYLHLVVDEALKREVTTPFQGGNYINCLVEEALNREVGTPVSPIIPSSNLLVAIEEALKRKVGQR